MSGKSKVNGVASPQIKIIDAIDDPEYEQFLYWCIIHRRAKWKSITDYTDYENYPRFRYLKTAIPRGFHMKVLFLDGDYIAMIEYTPAEVSGYPIKGDDIIVMNCIWVLRKYSGNNYAKLLVQEMMDSEKEASGFATIGLENHWMVWMKREQMEGLGFKSVRLIELMHKIKHRGRRFTLHLMWMPVKDGAVPPTWDESKLLEGTYFCSGNPLNYGRYGCDNMKEIYER